MHKLITYPAASSLTMPLRPPFLTTYINANKINLKKQQTLTWKPLGSLGLLNISYPLPLRGALQQMLYFPSPQLSVSRLALLCTGKQTQVRFINTTEQKHLNLNQGLKDFKIWVPNHHANFSLCNSSLTNNVFIIILLYVDVDSFIQHASTEHTCVSFTLVNQMEQQILDFLVLIF